MYLLNHGFVIKDFVPIPCFTFHNVSIKSEIYVLIIIFVTAFTFHNVSIKSLMI